MADERKTFCEFFAGIGLVREGLAASGWRCVYANDIAAAKHAAYAARFGECGHFHLADVWDTAGVVARIAGRPFLATASFPCVDLSVAGHYSRGLSGPQSSTFFAFAAALRQLGERKPRVVMVENVVGFLSSRKGADFAAAARALADLGYWLDVLVLDARHFTPQSRPRVFLFGVLPEGLPAAPPAGWLWPGVRPSPLRPKAVTAALAKLRLPTGWADLSPPDPPPARSDVLRFLDLDDGQAWWERSEVERHHRMMSGPHRERIDALLVSGERWAGTIFRRIRNEQQRAEVRFDGLAGCLRTPKGGSAKQIVVATGGGELRMRWMTPREYARLQGAPDFPLVGTTTQQLWGFADAVCVPAVAWLDRHILTPLYRGWPARFGHSPTYPSTSLMTSP